MTSTAAHSVRDNGAFAQVTRRLVAEVAAETPVRTGSLIVTLFGDAIAPHGGSVWLGSLIQALAPFGINQRSVRTAVFRLARDGWIASTQIGRRSFYSLTPEGRSQFDAASRRIYAEPRGEWSGSWCLALLSAVPTSDRDNLRKELNWLGFASFSANLLAHPAPDTGAIEQRLAGLPSAAAILFFDAAAQQRSAGPLSALVHEAWRLDDLDARYRRFLERFRPVLKATAAGAPDPADALLCRLILIHEYRKILLRDPMLPEALLPESWNGVAAYQLTRNIYQAVSADAERHLMARFESADGNLPPAEPRFLQRFGGIDTEDDVDHNQ
ncbi:MAG: phenylacetic acid degradation operon negative regulatory protein PaaX [Pseudomonadota bacterium]